MIPRGWRGNHECPVLLGAEPVGGGKLRPALLPLDPDADRGVQPVDLDGITGLDLEHRSRLVGRQGGLEGVGTDFPRVSRVVMGEPIIHDAGLRVCLARFHDRDDDPEPDSVGERGPESDRDCRRDGRVAPEVSAGGGGAGGASASRGCGRGCGGGRGRSTNEEPGDDPQAHRRAHLPVPRPVEHAVREDEPREHKGRGQEDGDGSVHG